MKNGRPWVVVIGFKSLLSLVLLIVLIGVLFTPAFWRNVYPIRYYPTIEREALISHVNPQLVAAVIRVESHFREDDVSHAGAIGLMQLMPDTATWIAKRTQMPDVTTLDLAQPTVNIRLGSWYLAYLLRHFNGNLPEAIAAYNAGPNRVRAWLESGVWNGTLVASENIPVRETRHFVERVLYTFQIFSRFY